MVNNVDQLLWSALVMLLFSQENGLQVKIIRKVEIIGHNLKPMNTNLSQFQNIHKNKLL